MDTGIYSNNSVTVQCKMFNVKVNLEGTNQKRIVFSKIINHKTD